MRHALLAATAAVAMLTSGTAEADNWPGFFRELATQAESADVLAPAEWSGFFRGEVLSVTTVEIGPGFLTQPPHVALKPWPDFFPRAEKPANGRQPEEMTSPVELASVVVTQSAELSSALATAPRSGWPGYLKFSGGYYDLLQDDNTAVTASVEYHAGRQFWWFDPFAGLLVTTEGAAYAYAGIALDVVIADRVAITPSAAVGLYHDGGGKDLGHVVEFRTGAEAAYIFNNDHRLGVSFYHLSNAGLGTRNPGTEILQINYSMPLTAFAGD